MKPRRNRLLPGTPVHHANHGAGIVLGEWGPIVTVQGEDNRVFSSCQDIYDCAFGRAPHQYMHCCRIEFLERI